MRMIVVDKLIKWLGPDGAIAGLDRSDITASELYDIASNSGLAVEKKMRRSDIINELVNRNIVRIGKTTEELLAMSEDDLRKYFEDKKVSTTELLNLLAQFQIRPGGKAKIKLVDFVAREVSDLGMYQRVAKGTRRG